MARYGVAALVVAALCGQPFLVTIRAGAADSGAVQVFTTPKGEAQNVRFEQQAGGTVHIFYDLQASDPRAVFDVALEASQDSGQTWGMRPRSVSGDVGPGIRPGPGKRIVWDSGKDVERLEINQFRFRISAQAGPLALTAGGGGAAAVRTGGMAIVSEPAGAQVRIDGAPRGDTPLAVDDLPVGAQIVISKAGYLENSREVTVVANERAFVNVKLTADGRSAPKPAAPKPPPATPATAKPDPPAQPPATPAAPGGGSSTAGGGGGGSTKWIIIAGGGAAAAAALALGGGGDPGLPCPGAGCPPPPPPANRAPTVTSASRNTSGTLLAGATDTTFEVLASDPDNDALSASWGFGDGSSSAPVALSGGRATISKVYSNAGTFTATVTVSDNRGGTATGTYANIVVGTLTALWAGRTHVLEMNLVQNANLVVGDYVDGATGNTSRVNGSITGPRNMTLSVFGGSIIFNLSASADLRTLTGNFVSGGRTTPFEMTRR